MDLRSEQQWWLADVEWTEDYAPAQEAEEAELAGDNSTAASAPAPVPVGESRLVTIVIFVILALSEITWISVLGYFVWTVFA